MSHKKFVAAILLSLFAVPAASPLRAAPAANTKFQISLDHPSNVGDREEIIGTCTIDQKTTGHNMGLSIGNLDDYVDAKYDEIVKITQLSDEGSPLQFRVFFRKLMMRDDEHAALDHAVSEGVPIDVTVWPDVSIVREDGQDIPDDEMMFLKELYHKSDPANAHSEKELDPPHEVGVGDTWRSSSSDFTGLLRRQGLLTPDSGGSITAKVVGRKTVEGTDCLVLRYHLVCPNVDGDTSVPDEVRSLHGSFERTEDLYVPTDSKKDVVGENISQTSKYLIAVEVNGQTIQGNSVLTIERKEVDRPAP